jgi:hypothetical protein
VTAAAELDTARAARDTWLSRHGDDAQSFLAIETELWQRDRIEREADVRLDRLALDPDGHLHRDPSRDLASDRELEPGRHRDAGPDVEGDLDLDQLLDRRLQRALERDVPRHEVWNRVEMPPPELPDIGLDMGP